MSAKNLRKRSTMESLQDRIVVVELSQRRIQFDKEDIVHTGMANIVAD